jgi:hypothetical protein
LPSVVSGGWNLVPHIKGRTWTEVFEHRVLREIFGGCKREEIIAGLRKSHIEELHDW